MERRSAALLFLFLFMFCLAISSDSQKLNQSTSLLNQEQPHEVTLKDLKGNGEGKSMDIFRSGKGSHTVAGGKGGGGRKASPKRNAAMEHGVSLLFSATSVFLTGCIMLSLTSFDMSIRL